jgi:hypothetical protein
MRKITPNLDPKLGFGSFASLPGGPGFVPYLGLGIRAATGEMRVARAHRFGGRLSNNGIHPYQERVGCALGSIRSAYAFPCQRFADPLAEACA